MALLPTGETMLDGHFLQEAFFPSERLGIAKEALRGDAHAGRRTVQVLGARQ